MFPGDSLFQTWFEEAVVVGEHGIRYVAQASRLEMLNGEAVEMAGQTNEACHLQLRSLFRMPAYSAYSAYPHQEQHLDPNTSVGRS